ncbi:hypothetical protein D6C81_00929 [Aureobasidium pullulans]|nr:hypothetical protein D6D11_08749 [Aureobasidium pullulans]TIA26228.1 hypothetical protein D6C81_00929 [Aureobasidium pullulans]
MAPSAKAANNGHHCPKAHGRDGNCRPWQGGGSKPQHCVAHQIVCPLHHEKHLKGEPCPECEKIDKFTGSLPPPPDLKPPNYKPTPSNQQTQRRPNQPKNRGAKRSANSRAGREGKGGNGKGGNGKDSNSKGGNGKDSNSKSGNGKGGNAQKPTRSKETSPTDPNTTPDLQTWSDLFSNTLFLALALSFVLVVTVIGLMSWTRRR